MDMINPMCILFILTMQQWPDFDSNGDLPVGIYQATLWEVIAHLGRTTLQRRMVAQRLARSHGATGTVHHFWVFCGGEARTERCGHRHADGRYL